MIRSGFVTDNYKLKLPEIFSSTILLSSAKLQIFEFSAKNEISLMNILNSNTPNIEPWSIPRKDHLLYEEPNLLL